MPMLTVSGLLLSSFETTSRLSLLSSNSSPSGLQIIICFTVQPDSLRGADGDNLSSITSSAVKPRFEESDFSAAVALGATISALVLDEPLVVYTFIIAIFAQVSTFTFLVKVLQYLFKIFLCFHCSNKF